MSESRVALQEYIRERVEGASSVSVVDLTEQAVRWVKENPAILDQLLAEGVRPLVYDVTRRTVARSRGTLTLVPGAGRVVKTHMLRAETRLRARFQNFLEYDGEKHVALLAMTRPQLLRAAQERETRGAIEMHYAELWRRLAASLPDDSTPLGGVLDAEAIAHLSAEISGVELTLADDEPKAAAK